MNDLIVNSYVEKTTYRSEIISALRTLGGQGELRDIYSVIKERGILPSIKTNPNWQAQVRKQLQVDSSDSTHTNSGKNLFYSVNGLYGGVWGIRSQEILDSPDTYDYHSNGEFAQEFSEGLHKTIKVNTFERNRALRKQCINIFGTNCIVCAFSFSQTYGYRGDGFIEVHHIVPLSEIRKLYTATPEHLRPVCSNCHSMIHRFKPFLTINEMTDLILLAKSA